MRKLLQKYALIISVASLVILLVTVVFYPDISRILSAVLLIFGIGAVTLFTLHSNWKTKQNDELTNAQFARNTTIDLLGLALTMGAAMWLGRMVGGYASETLGVIAGIVAGMVVGFGAALVIGKLWGKVSNRLRVTAA